MRIRWNILFTAIAFIGVINAQVPALPFTFTSAPVSAQSTGFPQYQNQILLLNPSIIGATNITVDQATGLPYGSNGAQFVIDIESMAVQSVFAQGANVRRGVNGTRSFAHGALARVWVASARYFWPRNPSGVCCPTCQTVTPAVAIPSGQAFTCQGTGTWATSTFPWNAAQFSWNAPIQGVWEQITEEQGDWNVATLSWDSAAWKWADTAGYEPQILNSLP
jgi:hypothetical protein